MAPGDAWYEKARVSSSPSKDISALATIRVYKFRFDESPGEVPEIGAVSDLVTTSAPSPDPLSRRFVDVLPDLNRAAY